MLLAARSSATCRPSASSPAASNAGPCRHPYKGKGGKRVTVASVVMPGHPVRRHLQKIYTEEGGDEEEPGGVLSDGIDIKVANDAPEPIFVDEIHDEVVQDVDGREARGEQADLVVA